MLTVQTNPLLPYSLNASCINLTTAPVNITLLVNYAKKSLHYTFCWESQSRTNSSCYSFLTVVTDSSPTSIHTHLYSTFSVGWSFYQSHLSITTNLTGTVSSSIAKKKKERTYLFCRQLLHVVLRHHQCRSR